MKLRLAALLLVAVTLTACGDPFRPQAHLANIDAEFTVFALTETPVALPTAVNIFFARPVRTDPAIGYDIVFDILDGQPVLLPPSSVGAFGRAGMIKLTVPYESVTEAPRTGYNENDPVPVQAGDVIAIRSEISRVCLGQLTPYIYARMQIVHIDAAERSFDVQMRSNPNCGFRSFEEGVPSF